MRIDGARVFGLTLVALVGGAAFASGWDWSTEFQDRHWRSSTLYWAQDSHPDHPSLSWIQSNFDPPPHELWCHSSPSPRGRDCTEFHALLDEWLQDFLDTDSVPQGAFNTFPKECLSTCTP